MEGGGEGDQTRRRWKRREGGGRGQAAGRRLGTVKSIIISISVFFFLLEIPGKKRDASARSLPDSDRESRCMYLRVLSEAPHKRYSYFPRF